MGRGFWFSHTDLRQNKWNSARKWVEDGGMMGKKGNDKNESQLSADFIRVCRSHLQEKVRGRTDVWNGARERSGCNLTSVSGRCLEDTAEETRSRQTDA